MSRNALTSMPRGRRRALSFGAAAGAALIAASISTATAPVGGAVVDADPMTDLIGAFDPLAFNASDAPTDFLGLVGYGIDTYLLGPTGLGTELDPMVDSWLTPVTSVGAATLDADPMTDLIGAFDPLAFNASDAPTDFLGLVGYGIDTYLLGPTGFGTELDPMVDDWLSSMMPSSGATLVDADPLSDLVGALDPTAFNALGAPDDLLGLLAVGLDNDLLAPLGLSVLLDPVIDSLMGSGTLF